MTKPTCFFLLILSFLVTGCSTTITNLTPRQQIRNETGLYPFEVAWDSNERAIRKETIQPYVIIGQNSFPMQPTPMVPNRWETLIPIPHGENFVNYRYKFDYDYSSIPQRRKGSRLSPPYRLDLLYP
jgi:hypothetical protein